MSVINANPLMLGDAGYNIGRSLRFRSSASAYLSRTPASATNQTTWTYSEFTKRGALGSAQALLCSRLDSSNYFNCYFNSSDKLVIDSYYIGTQRVLLTTTQVFRDPSAWYHIVLVSNTTNATAANRFVVYVNGNLVTAFDTATYPAQNAFSGTINQNCEHNIGRYPTAIEYFDGYLTEVNFIDGQALTPSSFGQTDPVTGVWTPKKYTGTYGTNGFYLPFSDNTSATTLAYDKSGNSNNWTANNISTTSGATYDSMTDVPTLTSATAANFAVLNPLASNSNFTLSNANLNYTATTTASAIYMAKASIAISSGKWYWEHTAVSFTGAALIHAGIQHSYGTNQTASYVDFTDGYAYRGDASKITNNIQTAYGSTVAAGDIIGIAFDADNGSLEFFKNNVSMGVAFTSITGTYNPVVGHRSNGSSVTSTGNINFGQRPFSYTPPTGFKALNTFNLPDPTIKKPNQYMDATAYAGTGVNGRSVANTGAMQPDLVWIKARNAAYYHVLFDSVRGTNKQLSSNATDAETTSSVYGYVSSFNADGFSVWGGSTDDVNVNDPANTYVGWQWKKGATPGFDIVTYTGNGSTANNVSHSLGVAPKMVIVKPRNQVEAWNVYHESLGNTKAVFLHLTNAATTSQYLWNNTSPTSSVFTVSTSGTGYTNQSGINYVAYLFAEIAGFSKFGSYTGNGSTDGPFVYCGFRPKYVLVKRADATSDWRVNDAARLGYNANNSTLKPNTSDAESAETAIDLLSNGFKQKNAATNNVSGGTYIYAAFAENPFKYSNAR